MPRTNPVARVGGYSAPIDTAGMAPDDKASFQFQPDIHPGTAPGTTRPGHPHFMDAFFNLFGGGKKPAPSAADQAASAQSAKINTAYNFAKKPPLLPVPSQKAGM